MLSLNAFLKLFKKHYTVSIKETIIASNPNDSTFDRPIESVNFESISDVVNYLKSKNLVRPSSRSYNNNTFYKSPIGSKPKITAHLEKGFGPMSKKQIFRALTNT